MEQSKSSKFEDELSMNEITNLLAGRGGPQGIVNHVVQWKRDFAQQIKDAVINRKPEVILGGRRFFLKHDHRPGVCFLKPETGYAPCGEILYDSVQEEHYDGN